MKRYEIALLFGSYDYEDVKTYEYDTLADLKHDLKEIIKFYLDCSPDNKYGDLFEIQISIHDQDEIGENNNTFTVCEIDMRQTRMCKEFFKEV